MTRDYHETMNSQVHTVPFRSPDSQPGFTTASMSSGPTMEVPGPDSPIQTENLRGLSGLIAFAFSKWAISSIVMTIILNRTNVYARTRRRIRLSLLSRLILRLPPIGILLWKSIALLRSIHCQTSPRFSLLRWGDEQQSSDLMFAFDLPVLHRLSSLLLLNPSDRQSCLAVKMIHAGNAATDGDGLHGSLSLLWPVFISVCLSWFVECLTCAVEGRSSGTDTGMSLLETSLAFSEAEGAITSQIGWDKLTYMQPAVVSAAGISKREHAADFVLTRAMVLNRVNTSPEMLVVAFLVCIGHISSNTLGIFNLQARYRLLSTGVWAVCFMAMLVSSWSAFSFDDVTSQSLLRLPTVCLLGWTPHMMLFTGMVGCLGIYATTVMLSTLSLDDRGTPAPFTARVSAAMENMQARISLTELRVTGQVDFYTALLRIGFAAVSLASEAVYLQEDHMVSLKPRTWLEEKRLQEFQSNHIIGRSLSAHDVRYDDSGVVGLIPVEYDKRIPTSSHSGYARQRAAQKLDSLAFPERRKRDGIGAMEKRNRVLMAVDLICSMGHLVSAIVALSLLSLLRAVGINWQPSLLVRVSNSISHKRPDTTTNHGPKRKTRPFCRGTIAGVPIPYNDNVDVEAEVRQAKASDSKADPIDENDLDRRFYKWFIKGGKWGMNDASGDYIPSDHEDSSDYDCTSDTSDDGYETDSQDYTSEGSMQVVSRHREGTPFADSPVTAQDLARLLHPKSLEDREAARVLSTHLSSDTIVTRSRFRHMEQIQRSRILMSRDQRQALVAKDRLDLEDEERLLEAFILARREAAARNSANGEEISWRDGGAGMGDDGPQCVVCQGSPRTIIVWPCRCLSLCDDCRIELAMKNYDKCVCCRREVGSFSRIFVP